MSKATEDFNAVLDKMSSEVEKATTPAEVEAIQARYESIVDEAEKVFEAALEVEFEAEAKRFEEERDKLDAENEPVEEPPETEKDRVVLLLSGLTEKQIQVRFLKEENRKFADILGVTYESKDSEKEIVARIYEYLKGLE